MTSEESRRSWAWGAVWLAVEVPKCLGEWRRQSGRARLLAGPLRLQLFGNWLVGGRVKTTAQTGHLAPVSKTLY